MPEEVAAALLAEFGYVPDERGGEKWVVYHDHSLLVMHPERLIRVYRRGDRGGHFCEIDPTPWR
jgi:hypothetical protein